MWEPLGVEGDGEAGSRVEVSDSRACGNGSTGAIGGGVPAVKDPTGSSEASAGLSISGDYIYISLRGYCAGDWIFSSAVAFVVDGDRTVTGDAADVLTIVFVATVSGASSATGGHSSAVDSGAISSRGRANGTGPEVTVTSLVKGSAISEATIDEEGAGG